MKKCRHKKCCNYGTGMVNNCSQCADINDCNRYKNGIVKFIKSIYRKTLGFFIDWERNGWKREEMTCEYWKGE